MITQWNVLSRINNHIKSESSSYYTKQELKQFLNCLEQLKDIRAFTFFRVLAFIGLRKGAALALQWNDIDFDSQTINVNKTLAELKNGPLIIQDTKTESSNRTVKIDNQTISILKKWKNHIIQQKLSLGIRR